MTWEPGLGAITGGREPGTRFTVWAPDATRVELVIESGATRLVSMHRHDDGCHRATVPDAGPGTLYRYRLDARGPFPDPASRRQPRGVHGPSQVVDPSAYPWTDGDWAGGSADLVLYELHVGTFTPEGTFRAAMERLPHLAALGITAVELMPVADFPGAHNWGYDGVSLFAPARCYGTPDELRAFVDAAHGLGLAVHLDVVYNHFGPDGAYHGSFSAAYFSATHRSPWGAGINFDGPGSGPVRRFCVENALHWIHEYHVDGLRLDATHAIVDDSPVHIAAEIAAAVHQSPRGRAPGARVIAEDHRNLAVMIRDVAAGGWGLDGAWSDDLHHQLRRALTGDQDGYFADFSGSDEDIARTIRDGWFFQGQDSRYFHGPRGSDPAGLPLGRSVCFIQNHDQVGNRAFGERLTHDVDAATYRAASALLLVIPESPLLFMGQEWSASTPFRYFTDHHQDLGRAVTAGRRREFGRFARFADPAVAATIPDPQAAETFTSCRLDWDELAREPHAAVHRLYQRLLRLRREEPAFRAPVTAGDATVATAREGAILVRRHAPGARTILAAVRLRPGPPSCVTLPAPPTGHWHVLFTTDDPPFVRDPVAPELLDDGSRLRFTRPGAAVLAAAPPHT